MKQSNRIKVFIIGSLIGVACAYFLFANQGAHTCWFPNCKVLERLRSDFQVTDDANCKFQCYRFGREALDGLYEDGDVDLQNHQEIDLQSREVIYDIVATNNNGRDVKLTIHFFYDFARLEKITWADGSEESCNCD